MTESAKRFADTVRGRGWLKNFSGSDRLAATLLLDSITYYSDNQFRAEMKALIATTVAAREKAPTAAFPIHNLRKTSSDHFLGCSMHHGSDECKTEALSGSELVVLNILEKLSAPLNLRVSPSPDEMYRDRIRRILLVTDQVVTGQEAELYREFVVRNPRIRSWVSFGWTTVEIVSHSVSDSALSRLGQVSPIHFEHIAKTFSNAGWTESQQAAIRDLCFRSTSASKEPLGRGDAESLQAYGHTVGNGLPAILRQTKRKGGGSWIPLLPYDRGYGFETAELHAIEKSDRPLDGVAARPKDRPGLRRTKAIRMALEIKTSRERFGKNAQPIGILLTSIDAGNHTAAEVADAADMSTSRFISIASLAHEYGLVDGYPRLRVEIGAGKWNGPSQLSLTTDGKVALRRLRMLGTRLTQREQRRRSYTSGSNSKNLRFAPDGGSYYPQSLR